MPSSIRIPALLTIAMALVMLAVGLNPRGFDGGNGVYWEPGNAGVRFDSGIAYTPPVLPRSRLAADGNVWTWQVALRTAPRKTAGFGIIAGLYSGTDAGQLQLAQWRRTLVVMAGDDYPHRLRGQRLNYELADDDDVLVLSIVRNAGGAILFVNGEAASRNPRVGWPPLGAPAPAQLVLGSTLTGTYPWEGILFGVALYDQALSAGQIRAGFPKWDRGPRGAAEPRPLLAFNISEPNDRQVPSTGKIPAILAFPIDYIAPELRAFSWPDQWRTPNRALMTDVIVNLIGFIPFGFCAAWLCWALPGRAAAKGALLAFTAGLLLSLLIELVQIWLPARDSSLLDLLTNSMGTAVGVMTFVVTGKSSRVRRG